jgi:hypothetical protein
MANVKISLLPSQTDILQVDGLAGYDSSGTIKISGTDLRDTLLSPVSGNLQIRPQAGTLVLGLQGQGIDINGNTQINGSLSLNVDSNTYGVIGTSSFTSVSFDGTAASTSTGYAVRLSGPVADSTNAIGASGEVLSSTGSGTQWVTAGGPTPGIIDVLTAGYTANTGQVIALTTGGVVTTYAQANIQCGGAFSITQGTNDLLSLGSGASAATLNGGAGAVQVGDTGNNLLISTNGSDKIQFSINGTGEVQFYLGTANPGPAIGDVLTAKTTSGDVEWTTPSGGPSKTPQTLTPGTTTWTIANGYNAILNNNTATTLSIPGLVDGDTGTLIVNTTASGTISWPALSAWPGGTPPALTNNGTDIFSFIYVFPTYYWSYGQDFS